MRECAVALGTFDGIHKGHLAVINAAKSSGYPCVAVTFAQPPRSLLSDTGAKLLMTREQKNAVFAELGIEKTVYLNFEQVKNMSPHEFLDDICESYNVRAVSCGFNYRFGKGAAGDTGLLQEYCGERGIKLKIAPPVTEDGITVCSTAVREMIGNGEIERANALLYKPFGFSSPVIHGDERGRTIGFPTANQIFPPQLTVPKFGVYATRAYVNGAGYNAITNIGLRPTYRVSMPLSETYLLGFDDNLYGAEVRIEFRRFFRAETRFSGIAELKNAIGADVERLKGDIKC